VYPISNNYHYLAKRCKKEVEVHYEPNGSSYTDYSSWNDTISLDYSADTPFEGNCNTELPDQQIGSLTYAWTFNGSFGRMASLYDGNYYSWNAASHCWSNHDPAIPAFYHIYQYGTGVGKIKDEIPQVNEPWVGVVDGPKSNLVYFKKGDMEWGSKVAVDCKHLVGNEKHPAPIKSELTIHPNPVTEDALVDCGEITFDGGLSVSLFNLEGSIIKQFKVENNHFTLSRDGIPPGVYLLVIKSDNTIKRGKIVYL
jgi:hypothetical protein